MAVPAGMVNASTRLVKRGPGARRAGSQGQEEPGNPYGERADDGQVPREERVADPGRRHRDRDDRCVHGLGHEELDMGGQDPGTLTLPPAGQALPEAVTLPPTQPQQGGWTPGRVVSVIAGAVLVLISLGLLGGGGTALWRQELPAAAAADRRAGLQFGNKERHGQD